MHRQLILVLFVMLATAALVSAQEPQPTPDSELAEPQPPTATMHRVNGAYQPLEMEPVGQAGPLGITAAPAADDCAAAPALKINDGGITDVRNFTTQADDPVLACMWGNPQRAEGYRTAWYEFTPAFNGRVTLSTVASTYDTVLAVYTGACGALTQIACNDDANYFTSSHEFDVKAGETYYVEVADWQSGASGLVTLNLQSLLQPVDSQWETVSTGVQTESFRSRHVVVAQGGKLYIIGGQTVLGSNSVRTASVYAYDTTNRTFQPLPSMDVADGFGYSNTTGALVNGRIYIPSGYTGNNLVYEGTHVAYDIAQAEWQRPANNSWADGLPSIYSQATPYNVAGLGQGYFLSGGLTGPFPSSSSIPGWTPRTELYYYSATLNQWFDQYASMPVGRFGHVAAIQRIGSDDHHCVAGGMSGSPGSAPDVLDSTYCFNISGGTWSEAGPLNYARYFASSAVDPYGNWYVFGGYDATGSPIAITERYDRSAGQWVALDARYNVGIANPGDPEAFVSPPRAWSRGAYVGEELWIVGGEAENQQVLNLVQHAELFRLPQMPASQYLPVLLSDYDSGGKDTFATAQSLPFNSSVQDRFYTADDMVNIYRFSLPGRMPVRLQLIHFGSGNSLDLVLYTDNKRFVAESRQPGSINENVLVTLNAGDYYVAVERIFPIPGTAPSSDQYLLIVGSP